MLSAEKLREALDYDPETGQFTWKKKIAYKVVVGSIAGAECTHYVEIGLYGNTYRGHRLAWLYMTGEWPSGEVDHIDQNKLNNRWNNLRDVGRSENLINQDSPLSYKKSCAYRGVFRSSAGRWFSRLKVNGVIRHLGTYDTPEEAYGKYVEAKAQEMRTWNG